MTCRLALRIFFLILAFTGFGARVSIALPSSWTITTDSDVRIVEQPDKIAVIAKENSYAFVSVPIRVNDLIRMTCEVFPNYSRSNSNGLLLFWDRDNWIRFTVVRLDVSAYGGWFAHRGGGYYLVSRMTDGFSARSRST